MKHTGVNGRRGWLLAILGMALLVLPGVVLAANLLSSGTFETFESYNGEDWRGYPEEKGQGWTVTVLEEDGLHFLKSDVFGQFSTQYYGVPYLNYRIEGNYSQVFASRRGFNFVFSQTVTVNNGQDYALGGKIVSFWKGSGGERDDTKIFKRIGIDPSGGASHTGPNVVWTAWEGLDNAWTSPALAVTAQSNQATVFIQVENVGGDVGAAYLNTGHLDSFRFELAPVASLNLPAQAAPGQVNVTWGVTIPDPGYWTLWGYDVEFKDSPSGSWQTLQTHNSGNGKNTSYGFVAEAGKTYSFRVRPWQERPGGDAATTALPGIWQEKSLTTGQAIVGQVTNHLRLGLGGVAVSVQGGNTTNSGPDGQYVLPTGGTGSFTLVAGNSGSLQAPPATVVTATANSATTFPLVLYPTGSDQAIGNNHFETDLSFWTISDPGQVTRSASARRTGTQGLLLTNSGQISQTSIVFSMRRPVLSFWYQSEAPLEVQFLTELQIVQGRAVKAAKIETLDPVSEWTYVILELDDGPEFYSGEIGVSFINSSGSTRIDEVSIALGPRKFFLPLILQE